MGNASALDAAAVGRSRRNIGTVSPVGGVNIGDCKLIRLSVIDIQHSFCRDQIRTWLPVGRLRPIRISRSRGDTAGQVAVRGCIRRIELTGI